MGIACGQGYFIARPERQPPRQLTGRTLTALDQQSLALSPLTGGPGKLPTARSLLGRSSRCRCTPAMPK
jgi:hypothetical protein